MKILIATDGSAFSRAAVEQCCQLVLRPGTEVMIVAVFEYVYPGVPEPAIASSGYYKFVEDSLKKLAEKEIDEAIGIIRRQFDASDVPVKSQIVQGAPDQHIIALAKEWDADLIVVGSHGKGFWGRLLGSVSTGVVHHAPCSVLVVKEKLEED
jgi:nucleotide-binding universal stress UspA family protein